MFSQFLMILAGLLALIGSGVFSYISLEHTVGPRETAQVTQSNSKKEITKPATSTQAAQKKAATKTISPTKVVDIPAPKAIIVKTAVVTPGPLRVSVPKTSNPSDLSLRGVIEYTNAARAQNGGLPALTENSLLDQDAQMKVNDMFTKQYFKHVSPTGVGPADLAKVIGYEYVIVGENLALGDFDSDPGVVTAWMNSPGHRANILNNHYQEIGVAVGRGMIEGRMQWLAVQSFGMPLSACPAISTALKAQIDVNNTEIARLRGVLDAKKAQVDATAPTDPNYNIYAGEFNTIVPQYNNLIESNRVSVASYNAGVQAFNDCVSVAGAH